MSVLFSNVSAVKSDLSKIDIVKNLDTTSEFSCLVIQDHGKEIIIKNGSRYIAQEDHIIIDSVKNCPEDRQKDIAKQSYASQGKWIKGEATDSIWFSGNIFSMDKNKTTRIKEYCFKPPTGWGKRTRSESTVNNTTTNHQVKTILRIFLTFVILGLLWLGTIWKQTQKPEWTYSVVFSILYIFCLALITIMIIKTESLLTNVWGCVIVIIILGIIGFILWVVNFLVGIIIVFVLWLIMMFLEKLFVNVPTITMLGEIFEDAIDELRTTSRINKTINTACIFSALFFAAVFVGYLLDYKQGLIFFTTLSAIFIIGYLMNVTNFKISNFKIFKKAKK